MATTFPASPPGASPTSMSTSLPAPTGRYAVGRITSELIDPQREEIYSSDPADRRELVLWVWYPAAATTGAERAPYVPEAWSPITQFLGLTVDGRRAHAIADAPVAAGERYPVLLMTPSGFSPLLLSALAEELASHGIVVVGINPTYETAVTVFADGRTLPMNPAAIAGALGPQSGTPAEAFARRRAVCEYKTADLASAVDHLERADREHPTLAGHLDLSRVGAIGHSFGGNASLEWCRRDARCRVAVNLDGAIWTDVGTAGLDRPALQVLADHPEFAVPAADAVRAGVAPSVEWFEAEKAITFDRWRTLHERARPGYTARIAGATHLSFMDVPFLPASPGSPMRAMLASTSIEPRRMWRVTSDLVLAFVARHLDGRPAPLLDGARNDYPEVTFGPT